MTAQGRLSGVVIAGLVPVSAGILLSANPRYIDVLFDFARWTAAAGIGRGAATGGLGRDLAADARALLGNDHAGAGTDRGDPGGQWRSGSWRPAWRSRRPGRGRANRPGPRAGYDRLAGDPRATLGVVDGAELRLCRRPSRPRASPLDVGSCSSAHSSSGWPWSSAGSGDLLGQFLAVLVLVPRPSALGSGCSGGSTGAEWRSTLPSRTSWTGWRSASTLGLASRSPCAGRHTTSAVCWAMTCACWCGSSTAGTRACEALQALVPIHTLG